MIKSNDEKDLSPVSDESNANTASPVNNRSSSPADSLIINEEETDDDNKHISNNNNNNNNNKEDLILNHQNESMSLDSHTADVTNHTAITTTTTDSPAPSSSSNKSRPETPNSTITAKNKLNENEAESCTTNKEDDNNDSSHSSIKKLKLDEESENHKSIETTSPQTTTETDRYESMQPRLKKFLKIYQQSSKTSLGGPTQNDIETSLTHNNNNNNNNSSSNIIHSSNDSNSIAKKLDSIIAKTLNSTLDNNNNSNNNNNNNNNNSDNLSMIANVALAAAAAAAANNKMPPPLNLPLSNIKQEDVNDFNIKSNRSSSLGSSNQHHHHHNHHHHHHKRLKYLSNSNLTQSTSSSQINSNKQLVKENSRPFNINSASYLKCMQADSNTSPLMETLLHGERISCFIVGGEKRLCLHDILNTILKDFSVQQINNACQKLQIACLESTPKQLDILKKNHLLPVGAPNCGLLTQSNAERLCAYLLDSSLSIPGPPVPAPSTSPSSESSSTSSTSSSHSKSNTIKVVHECFGKTYGHIHTHMYSRSDAPCVECDTCRKLYTPKNFVCHTHKYESNIRHWGFDSANWRIYLKLASNNTNASAATNNKQQSIDINNNESSNNVLGMSNKDNIAANLNNGKNNNTNNSTNTNNKKDPIEEEFELFKKKFLNTTTATTAITVNRIPSPTNNMLTPPNITLGGNGAFKRKSVSYQF